LTSIIVVIPATIIIIATIPTTHIVNVIIITIITLFTHPTIQPSLTTTTLSGGGSEQDNRLRPQRHQPSLELEGGFQHHGGRPG
jgi:hypothetical protein